MKEKLVGLLVALSGVSLMAAGGHWLDGPTLSISTANNSLTVSGRAAGLGNTTTSVGFELNGTINVTSQCFTRNGNPVNGVPKTETAGISAAGTAEVKNGSVRIGITVSPISTLQCTGSQRARILSVNSYNLTLSLDGYDSLETNFHS